jgi:glycosyltransferase involved in cell wall biosynthesis
MRKVLSIMQLPPPIHGASLMNRYLRESNIINNNFDVQTINLQFSSSQKNIEKFSFLKVLKSFYYALAIFIKAVRFKPDLAYFTLSSSGYAFYRDTFYVLILKLFNLKILFHLHGKGIKKEVEKSILKRKIYKFVFRNTNVICLSSNLAEDIKLVSFSLPYIVPCGIPVVPMSNQEINKTNKIVQILFLSNYIENKGILKLIDALGLLKDQGVIFNARLVGAPTDLKIETIESYIKKRKLENCVFAVGPRYGEDKYNEFLASDIFAFPTFYSKEAFPLVNLEAMQFSLPVISTNEGGISEAVIDDVTGFVVEPRNVQQLADKLKILIQNKHLREEMGLKGKEHFSKNFTLEHYEQNMKTVFDTILKTEDSHKLLKDLKAVSIIN